MPASTDFVAEAAQIVEECPALRSGTRSVESKFDAITVRDAYWQRRIANAGLGLVGIEQDSCR